jgi:carboxypeptidase family protein
VRWLVVIVVAACARAPEILYPPVTGHQATPFSEPPPAKSCQLTFVTEYIDSATSSATLHGTVVDSANRPAVGATVVATGRALVGEQVVITDEAGRYNIGALPPGDYTLTIYYENRTATHAFEIRRGVESIDHARTLARGCEVSRGCRGPC